MTGKALKDKLQEQIQSSFSVEIEPLEQQVNNNVVPFIKPESQPLSIVPDFAITMQEARSRIQMLQSFVQEMMIQGVDFGIVPGCNKPSLLKPGAEKLCDIFGFSKQIDIINRIEDWDKGIFHYEIKATLISKRTGHIESEGIGSCNSKEKKYKNQEPANVINTILKMAKKRALIDAVLSATRSSGIFTQDVEDMEITTKPSSAYSAIDNIATQNTYTSIPQKKDTQPANKNQLAQILKVICQNKIPISKAKDLMVTRYKVSESKFLSSSQANDFISYLNKCGVG